MTPIYSYKNVGDLPPKKKNKKRNKKRKLSEILKKNQVKLNDSNDSGSENSYEDDIDDENIDDEVSSRGNHIYFKTDINQDSIERLIKIIESKNIKFKKFITNKMVKFAEPNPLYLHITSYGGDLLASFRAIDAIKRSVIPIFTIVDSYAASGATLMSIVGKKRYMTPNSYMLIHQLTSGTMGKWMEIQDDFDNCQTWMDDIYKLYIANSAMDEAELKRYLSHDLWWKIDKCIELGMVDEPYTQSLN